MRKILLAVAAFAVVGFVAPTVQSANAQTVVVKHRDNGMHRGWDRGRHVGWRNHNRKVVVIKRGRGHRDHD